MSVRSALIAWQGAATRRELLASGLTVTQLAAGVNSGAAIRARRGWYVLPDAEEALEQSVRVGGRMACLTALRSFGVWVLDDGRLHVHVPESGSRLRSRHDRSTPLGDRIAAGTCVHRERVSRIILSTRLRVSLEEALAEVVAHGDRERALVAIDSAMNRGLLTTDRMVSLFDNLPAKYRAWRHDVDPAAESGIESIVRLRMKAAGATPQSQVRLADGIRVDFLVGDRLVIEVDGRAHHADPAAFERDRRRDLYLKAFGYEVLRLSYAQVMDDWSSVAAALARILDRGDHRFRRAGA